MQSLQPKVIAYGRPLRSTRQRARRRRAAIVAVMIMAVALLIADPSLIGLGRSASGDAALTPLQNRIVSIAESQVGYHSNPSNTYCNQYSAFWASGASDCGNSNRDEEWCADFAAWVWRQAGVQINYQFINGDINSSSASFYEWGIAHRTWHPYGTGYIPQPGDVVVYGLQIEALTAVHVAVVVSFTPGNRAPNVVNGDGDRTGHSVVETGMDQFYADAGARFAHVSGYVSPTDP